MKEQGEKRRKFLLPMGKGRKEKYFSSFQDYCIKIKVESSKWSWVGASDGCNKYLSASIYGLVVAPLYVPYKQGLSEEQTLAALNEYCKHHIPIYSFSPEGKFVLNVLAERGRQLAKLVLYYFSSAESNSSRLNPNAINDLASMPSINQQAILLVSDFRMGGKGKSRTYAETVESDYQAFIQRVGSIADELDELVKKHESNGQEHFARLNEQIKEQNARLNEQIKEQSSRFKKHVFRYIQLARQTKALVRVQYDQATSDVENAKQAYHESIDFEYSVNYWKNRQRSHAWGRVGWFFCILFSLPATFGGMLAYYLYGGISGIVMRAGGRLAEHASFDDRITEAFIADIVGAALLLTLLAVLVRLSLRQFNIVTQLHIEAAERVTMVKTYLALLNEGKLIAEQDRRLALESLFRSSQLSPSIDSGFNTPVDLIKTLVERVGK